MRDGSQPQTASEWLVALQESPEDPLLRRSFSSWLMADAANLQDWREVSHVDRLLGELGPSSRVAVSAPVARRRSSISRRAVFALAGAGLAAAVALLLVTAGNYPRGADLVTATAEMRHMELADGSHIDLGPESALAVNFSENRRIVHLMSGEAFFDVAPDKERPFHVITETLEARVVGTAFEVQLVEEATTIAVQEGAVEVLALREMSGAERLGAGDWLHLSEEGALRRDRISAGSVAAWRRGQLVVKDRPISEVVSMLRRYHAGFILMSSGELAAETLTGAYTLHDPVAALRAMAKAHGAEVTQFTPWVLVLSR